MIRYLRQFSAAAIIILIQSCTQPGRKLPLLVIAGDENFGSYTCEILKAEGLNEFTVCNPGCKDINPSFLKRFEIVVLAKTSDGAINTDLFRNYVDEGGNLIACMPGDEMADIFGIQHNGSSEAGIMTINTSDRCGKGMLPDSFTVHCRYDIYTVVGGRIIASISSDKDSVNSPAVVWNDFGKGHAVAFAYNLPEAVVLTRQGNPGLAGTETDGINGIRAMDMFTGGWVSPRENTLNHADEQMHLLAGCIKAMADHPLPAFWYFPDTLRCLVTLTNDGETKADRHFEQQFRDIDSMNARMTLYVMEEQSVAPEWVSKWSKKGFEISGHPDNTSEAANPVQANVSRRLSDKIKEIRQLYGLEMNTIVNHWFVWCGKDSSGNAEFASQAEIEAQQGIGMDINYAHYDNNSTSGHFLGVSGHDQGNFTGSGLPMKFSKSSGEVLDIYQHLNNVYDQKYNENHDPEGFFEAFRGIADRSLHDDIFSYISIKSHNDEYYFSKEPLLKMLEYSRQNSIPVWTASELLGFLRMKDEASFREIKWKNNTLEFELNSSITAGCGLTFLVPEAYGNITVNKITVDGISGNWHSEKIRGTGYAMVTVSPGRNHSIGVEYR